MIGYVKSKVAKLLEDGIWKYSFTNVMTNVFIFNLVRIIKVISVCYEQFIHCTKFFVMFYDFKVYLSLFIPLKG